MAAQTFSSHLLKLRGCTWVISLRLGWRTWYRPLAVWSSLWK
jgi:hypothetical protein